MARNNADEVVTHTLSRNPRAERDGVKRIRFPAPMKTRESERIAPTKWKVAESTDDYVYFVFGDEGEI